MPLSDCLPGGLHDFEYYDTDNCIYTGTTGGNNRTDCQGTTYQIFPNDARNTMSYANRDCRSVFTVGQAIRMREALDTQAVLQPLKGTIASLYEPYKGEYYLGGPVSGGGPVAFYYRPLFQPGFDYRFVECDCEPDCNEPSPYEDTSFTTINNTILSIDKEVNSADFNTITHPNHTAIKILFAPIGPASSLSIPRRCYYNWSRGPIGGSLTKFNDGVFNANVTITPKDSTAINDPSFITNLQPGLYTVNKLYEDGATQQEVIVKDNNE